jgi:hypothetical protein
MFFFFFVLYLVFCGSGFLCFLLMMALLSVGWFGLHGFAPVGRRHYAGQRGLDLLSVFLCYLLSSNRDDSVQKTAASLPFCRANCVRTCVLVRVRSVFYIKMKILMVLVQLV